MPSPPAASYNSPPTTPSQPPRRGNHWNLKSQNLRFDRAFPPSAPPRRIRHQLLPPCRLDPQRPQVPQPYLSPQSLDLDRRLPLHLDDSPRLGLVPAPFAQ